MTKNILAAIGSKEWTIWVTVAIVSALLWAFMEIADDVMEGETRHFDEKILMSMRDANDLSDLKGPAWLEEVGKDITAMGGNTILSLLSIWVVCFLALTGKRKLALVVILATGGALLASLSLKFGFDRARPELVPHATIVYTSSFPSGHSMLSASTYLTLGALLARSQKRRRVKAFIVLTSLIITLLIGVSRVYLGVHWPTDVLAGWTVGSAWALACWYLARRLQRLGKVEPESR